MPTEEFRSILQREIAKAEAAELIEAACPLLREIVNHGTHALARCLDAADENRRGGEHEDLAVFSLYRQLLEQIDGLEVLFSQSCSEASVPLLRAAFETSVSLDYLFRSDAEYVRRALSWAVAYLYRRIERHELHDPATARGRQFTEAFRRQFGDVPASELSIAAVDALNSVLDRAQFRPVRAEFEARRMARRGRAPDWFTLFGGPSDRRQLARLVGREAEYLLLYSDWSDVTHAATAAPYIRLGREQGEAGFVALRSAEQLAQRACLGANMMLQATRQMLNHFRPREDVQRWYLGEVQQRLLRLCSLRVVMVDR